MDNLLMQITRLDFYAVDLQLYLDTHPGNKEAIALYNKTTAECRRLKDEYERTTPLNSFTHTSNPDKFTWVAEPWPWEKEFYA